MATKPPAKTAKKPVARTATTAAGAAPAGNDTTAGASDGATADGGTDTSVDNHTGTGTTTDAAADTTDTGAGAGNSADSATAAAGVLQLAAGRADEATERLAEQAQRPAVTLPAGQAVYRVLSPLNHDLRDYPAGSDITLTVDQAAPLLGHTVEPKNATADDA